jgi:hypothetical protein
MPSDPGAARRRRIVRHRPCTTRRPPARTCRPREPMLDVLFVLATVAFFGLSLAYVRGCDRL